MLEADISPSPIIIQFSNPNYEPLRLSYLFLEQEFTAIWGYVLVLDKYQVNKNKFLWEEGSRMS